MEPFALTAAIIGLLGSCLGLVSNFVAKREKAEKRAQEGAAGIFPVGPAQPRRPSGLNVLLGFSVIVFVFGIVALFSYWHDIRQNADTLFFASALFLAMVAGMFVRVVSSNYSAGDNLFDVTASQLVFPLLFALIVYYPIWALAASSPRNLFSFYAAFLNGYFWESVVSAARRPTRGDGGS